MSAPTQERAGAFTYAWPRPSVTVDCVVFGIGDEGLSVLLVERGGEPFAGQWALPGGFVREAESLEAAALRELTEETGLTLSFFEQLYTFGAPDRDPRGRVITVAFYALVKELAQLCKQSTFQTRPQVKPGDCQMRQCRNPWVHSHFW